MFQNSAPSGSICLLVLLVPFHSAQRHTATAIQQDRAERSIETIPLFDQLFLATENHWKQGWNDPKTIDVNGQRPKNIQWWWFPQKTLKFTMVFAKSLIFPMFSANYNIMYSAVSFLYNGPTENTFFPFMQACDSLQVEFTHFLLHWIFQTKNCVTIVQLQGRITASVSMQMKVTHTTQPSSCSSLQLIFLFCELREVVNKKNGYFTVRLTVRGGGGGGHPPPAWP